MTEQPLSPREALERLLRWPMLRSSLDVQGNATLGSNPNDIAFIHDIFIEYYAAEWLIDQLSRPDWFDTFDEIGAIEQYPTWSKTVNLMCDLLSPEQHEKIIKRYQDRQEHGYALSYLVKHAALSRSPEKVLDFITPSYVRKKLTKLQSTGLVIDDANIAITVAADSGDIFSAIKFGALKGYLAAPVNRTLLGLESVLRVRMGKIDHAIADVEHFCDEDDHLFVYAERVAQLWDCNSNLAGEYVRKIDSVSQNCSPEVLELAATRIAEVTPALASRLARRIPEPEFLNDPSSDFENPNRGRCVFRLFRMLAKSNLGKAMALAEEAEVPFNNIYDNVAIGTAILPEQPSKAFEFFRMALSDIPDDGERFALSCVLARYVFWHIPDMDFDSSIAALQGITEFIPLNSHRQEISDIIDAKISSCPKSWLKVLEELPDGSLKEFIQWRMAALGHILLSGSETFEDQRIQDMVQAKRIADTACVKPLEAAELAMELITLVGRARAIAAIAMQLEDRDKRLAQVLIDQAFSCMSIERNWDGFDAALELLKVAIRWPGLTRQRILTWCWDTVSELKPRSERSDAILRLGHFLAESFLQSMPDEAAFLRSLILEFDAEIYRHLVASYIFEYLPEDVCEAIALRRVEYGLIPEFGSSEPTDNALFLPETQMRLLARLAERLLHSNSQIASQLLLEAADISAYIEDETDRNEAVRKVISCAMRIAPSFVWKVHSRCNTISKVYLFSGIKQVLREYAGLGGDIRERFVRLFLETLLANGDWENDPEYRSYVGKRLYVLDHEHFPALSITPSRSEKPSDKWLEDLTVFFAQCIENFESEGYSLFDLHEITELVAKIDWNTFAAIVRNPKLGPASVKNLDLKKLRGYLPKSHIDAPQLLDDIEAIQRVRDDTAEDRLKDIFCTVLAAAAAFEPDTCIDMVASYPADLRCSIIEKLECFSPERIWTEQKLLRLFALLEESRVEEKVIIAEACLVGWLGQHFQGSSSIIEHITGQAIVLSEISDILKVAGYIEQADKNASEAFILAALDLAIESRDAYGIVEIIDTGDFLTPEVCLRALAIAREIDSETVERYRLDRIAKHQAKLDPEEAVVTLGLMKQGDTDISDVLDVLSSNILVKDESDIKLWISKVSELKNLSQEDKSHFALSLIKLGLELGIIDSADILLAKATREAENVASIHQRQRELCRLAELYIHSDHGMALKFYRRSLEAAAKYEQALPFIQAVADLAEACFRLAKEQARELAVQIHEAVQAFSYGRNYRDEPDAKAQALVWSAVALWSFSESEGIRVVKEAAIEHNKETRTSSARMTYWRIEVTQACLVLAKQSGMGTAAAMLDELLSAFPDSRRQAESDEIARSLRITGTGVPLEHLGIYQMRLDETKCTLLKHLLPVCSLDAAVQSHMAIGISAWGKDHQSVVREFSLAANITEQIGNSNPSVWTAYAAVHGLEGCIRAIRSSLPSSEYPLNYIPHLLVCALKQIPQKVTFLRELWSILQSLRDYL